MSEKNLLMVGTDRHGRTWLVLDRDESFRVYYMADGDPSRHVIYDSLDEWKDPPRVLLGRAKEAEARVAVLEQLARDLLARLSQDYGNAEEGDNDAEVEWLFAEGERILPVMQP